MSKRSVLVSGLLALVASPAALSADFTFNVPLQVENVPSMDTVEVRCLVSRVRVGEPYAAAGRNVVGRGSTTVHPVDGAYSGTVRVEIDADGIDPAASARSYSCSVSARGEATTGARYAASPGNFGDAYERATGHSLDRTELRTRDDL